MVKLITDKLAEAENIVHAYGQLLAQIDNANTAHPESLLPHAKLIIKQAIQTLLWELEDAEPKIRDGLAQAYMFLDQFIPDAKVEVLIKGQTAMQSGNPQHVDWAYADEAGLILSQMKIAMENTLEDLRIFLR
jgi:hypothetical protein